MGNNIGIVTFYNAYNQGAVLQAYALKKKCSDFNCYVFFYRHENNVICGRNHIPLLEGKNVRRLVKNMLEYPSKKVREVRFERFIRSRLLDTKVIANPDLYICGSDQVWNYNCTDFDRTYFLDFARPEQKYAYAASFGFDRLENESIRAEYTRLLSGYQAVSLREKQGAILYEELTGNKAQIVLDPTLLLSRDEWAESFNLCFTDKNYILVYSFGITEGIYNIVYDLQKRTKMKVVVLSEGISRSTMRSLNCLYCTADGPEEWLKWFAGASVVVTNSFHGTAFSINFNKKFYVELLYNYHVNSRILSILDSFGLQGRLLPNVSPEENIDYKTVNTMLEKSRNESLSYLKTICI